MGFPSFLNWSTAAAAAAVAVPALLILYFLKLRRREMAVSSTLLWKKSIQDLQVNAPFQKLRKNLLLLLQLLLLVLLLLALSRPVVNARTKIGKLSVLLIDHSASMSAKDINGRTRLDEAKRRAKEAVDSMGRDAYAMVVAFHDTAETVQTFTSDAVALRNAIDAIQPTDRKTQYELAYQLAEAQSTSFYNEQLRPSESNRPDVLLFSDGRAADIAEAGVKLPLTYNKIGTTTAGNIAILALNAKRNYERPTQVQVFARLANYGPDPAEASLRLTVNGQPIDSSGTSSQVWLLPERWTEDQRLAYERDPANRPSGDGVQFELEMTTGGLIQVEQTRKNGDALAADDSAAVIVPPPKNLTVLVVTDGNYFLEKAIHSQTQIKDPKFIRPAEYEAQVPSNYDVIIFDRHKPTKLPAAGNFIYFGAVPDGLKLKIEKDAAGVDKVIEDVGVLDWKRDHPLLRGINLSQLYVGTALKLDVPLDSEVLVDGLKGPLVVRHLEGKGTHLVVAFDLLQSNWPLRQSFPYFIYNALQFLAVGADLDVKQSFPPGAAPAVPRAALTKGEKPITRVSLVAPDGKSRTLEVPQTGDFTLPPLNQVGVYKTDPPLPGWEQIAVNLLDANESDLVPADKAPSAEAVVEAKAGGQSRRELWRLLTGAALGLLFVEWWVYTRRVHL